MSIREQITASTLRTLDRMADGHMQPMIEIGNAWECETTRGETYIVPAGIAGNDPTAETLDQYRPEGCAGKCASFEYRRNVYLCRMSAPGYMDCTDWEAHETAQAAADSLVANYADCDIEA